MKYKIYQYLSIIGMFLALPAFLKKPVYAGTYVSGHTFVQHNGEKVHLEGVEITWRIIGKSKYRFLNTFRVISSGDTISKLYTPEGILSKTINCTKENMGYGNKNKPACLTDEFNHTIDTYNNINFVFPRISAFGCSRDKAYIRPSFPKNYKGLPAGLNPEQGNWNAHNVDLAGRGNANWNEELQILEVKNLADNTEIINLDFEWIPGTPRPIPSTTFVPPAAATPTPTPTPPAPNCFCDETTINSEEGPARVKRGEAVTIKTTAHVDRPDVAKVKEMVYSVTKEGKTLDLTGQPNPIVSAQPIDGQAGYYSTSWQFTPSTDDQAFGLYKVNIKINCAWKDVAGASVQKPGLFTKIRQFFSNLLRGENKTETSSQEPFPTTVVPTGSSLQLGTFYPVPTLPPQACTYIYFQVPNVPGY